MVTSSPLSERRTAPSSPGSRRAGSFPQADPAAERSAKWVGNGCSGDRGVEGAETVSGERLAMAEADDVGVEAIEAAERTVRESTVAVEGPEDHLSLVLGGDVAGEQDPELGEVQRDAAVGVAGGGSDSRSEPGQDLAVVEVAVHPGWRGVGQVGGDGRSGRSACTRAASR